MERERRAITHIPPREQFSGSSSVALLPQNNDAYLYPAANLGVYDLITEVSREMPHRQRAIYERAMTSRAWGEWYSLREIPNFQGRFTRILGEIKLPPIPKHSPYSEFYTGGRIHDDGETVSNRGVRYFASYDPTLTAEQKADVIHEDIRAALRVTNQTERRPRNEAELLLNLGVADYLKNGFLIAYHALTYNERTGVVPQDDEYLRYKENLMENAVRFTRRYYQMSLGRAFDEDLDPEKVMSEAQEAFAYIKRTVDNPYHFKLAEIDHPLIIMANAHENALKHHDIDTIVGIPNGGTQAAIATQLAMEYVQKKKPELAFVPFSVHAITHTDGHEMGRDTLREKTKALEIGGKNVLVTDDTITNGVTIQSVSEALLAHGAASVKASVCEIDPLRHLVKHTQWDNPPPFVANLTHPDFRTAFGIMPITRGGGEISSDRQMRKLRILGILSTYYREALPFFPEVDISTEVTSNSPFALKIDRIHNSIDLATAIQNGATMIGIDMTYNDQDAYGKSLSDNHASITAIELKRAQDFSPFKQLPLPWAEYKSIKEMITKIASTDRDITTTLLMNPQSPSEVLTLLQTVLPRGFTKPLMIQLQSTYDQHFLAQVRETLNSGGFESVKLIQKIAVDDIDVNETVRQIDRDPSVDFVLCAVSQPSTARKASTTAERAALIGQIEKRMIIGGDPNLGEVQAVLSALIEKGIRPYGVDFGASLEFSKDNQVTGTYPSEAGPVVIVRKDGRKIFDFVTEISAACAA